MLQESPSSINPPHLNPPLQGGRKKNAIKIGHAGTLDPLASGVLPLALGEATKTVAFMMDAAKAYSFTVKWGEERDSDDSQGKTTATSGKRPSVADIMAILPQFTGLIEQTPPSYSAIHIDGKRAYELAREGEKVELRARQVRVDSLLFSSPLEGDGLPQASFICHCGKGTYIRSLARDMGRQLGCLGHIIVLRRLKVGKFDESQAISLELLEKMVHKGDLGFLTAVESVLDDIPAMDLTDADAAKLKNGQPVLVPGEQAAPLIRARANGKLVALCKRQGKQLKPERVFNL